MEIIKYVYIKKVRVIVTIFSNSNLYFYFRELLLINGGIRSPPFSI